MMKKIRKILTSFALALLCLFMCLPCSVATAYADGISIDGGYTPVLDDLRKDEQFSETDYPVIENNYMLQVITISESVDKELFVYVYQPHQEHGKYIASSINISATTDNSLDIMNYSLTLVGFDGVFQKYLVTGITLPTSETRYYDVISIYRVFDETIDEGLSDDNDNTINEVVYAVSKAYVITDMENGPSMSVKDLDVIRVTDKYCGFLRLTTALLPFPNATSTYDVHFVAFSTDKVIDDLLEADVYYETQHHVHQLGPGTDEEDRFYPSAETTYKNRAFLKKEDYETLPSQGWFAKDFSFHTIEDAKSFADSEYINYAFDLGVFSVKNVERISDATKNNIKNCDWVLRYAVTNYDSYSIEGGNYNVYYTERDIVGNVSILRLKFETDDVIYNLGVIDNKQSADLIPDNVNKTILEVADWFKIVIALLALILVLYVLGPILPLIFSIIGGILKFVFKIITYPFRLIFGAFRRR